MQQRANLSLSSFIFAITERAILLFLLINMSFSITS